jgi:hypothetical protein
MQNQLHKLSDRRSRRARRIVVLCAAAALALPASAFAARGFSIRLHIANHTPIVGKRWPIELTVMRGNKKLDGTIRYEFLFDKAVVSTEPKHGSFKFEHGVYRDNLVFPTQSVGEPLTLRFVVRTRFGTQHVDWALHAKKRRTKKSA